MPPTKEECQNFEQIIDKLVKSTNLNYVEAIIHHCETTGLELEVAISLTNKNLKLKMEADAMKCGLLKDKVIELPI